MAEPLNPLQKRRAWRRELKAEFKVRGIEAAHKQWIVCVRPTAIPMPAWVAGKRIAGLTFTESTVWLPRPDAKYLIALDRENGGSATYAETEYRRCMVCARPLLGADAELRRRMDESTPTGRMMPCGSECIEASKDGRWKH
jgi:hypothetical protein